MRIFGSTYSSSLPEDLAFSLSVIYGFEMRRARHEGAMVQH
jgi:hypothetical protein